MPPNDMLQDALIIVLFRRLRHSQPVHRPRCQTVILEVTVIDIGPTLLHTKQRSLIVFRTLVRHSEIVLDSALLAAKIFQACCELPVLKLVKPAAAIMVIICETAKTVTTNASTAQELSEHATQVLDLVTGHLCQTPAGVTPDLERDVDMLYKILEKINEHIRKLRDRKRSFYAWVWSQKDKEDLVALKGQLDQILITFGVSRTLSLKRHIAQVEGVVRDSHKDIKHFLSRVNNTVCLHRTDEPRVIHGDCVHLQSVLSGYAEYIPESSAADIQVPTSTVIAIRLHKATYHGPHGEVLPIIAMDYDSGMTEMDFVKMCQLHRSLRNPYLAQVYGASSSHRTLYFFSSQDCLPIDQVMQQGSEEEILRCLSQLNEAVADIAVYLWKEKVPLLIAPETCVIQGDKVVLMDIPSPIESHSQRMDGNINITDVEVSIADDRKRKLVIKTIYSHGTPH